MPTVEELIAEEAIRDAFRRDSAVSFTPVAPGYASGLWIVPGSILRHVHMGGAYVCVRTRDGAPVVQREYTVHNPSEWQLVGRVKPLPGATPSPPPDARITTREAAIEEMLRWAHGEKSHWNEFARHAQAPEMAASALGECARADAAEVQKWAAVAAAFPPAGTEGDAMLLKRCVALIGLLPESSFGPYGLEARELLRDLQRAQVP